MAGLFQRKPSRFRNFNRLRKVLSVLAKYGFDDIVAHSQLRRVISRRKLSSFKKEGQKIVPENRFERLRLTFEELGPTFIKLGQILSNRHDLLPRDLIRELEKLQDNVSPEEINVRELVERELQIRADDVFEEIEQEAVASASIAQVHRAKLKNGDRIVLKIQRPGLRNIIEADIEILRYMLQVLQKRFPEMAVFQPLDLLKSFERSIKLEMNFAIEANNIQRFKANFKDDDRIYVPAVYREYSNERILCMEEVIGVKISDLDQLRKREVDLDKITTTGTDVYFRQVFKHGYFHADPHPGNILVMNDERLCFLDFGMMGSILPRDKEVLGDLVVNVIRQDVKKIVSNLEKLSVNHLIEDKKHLEYDLYDLIQEISAFSLKDLNMEMLYDRFHLLVYRYKLVIPADLFLLMRAFVTLEGLGFYLKPDFNLFEEMKPYARTLILHKYNPKHIFDNSVDAFLDVKDLMTGFPEDVKQIIQNVKEGRLKIAFAHQGLDGLYNSLDRVTNRLSLAIITAALIVGSSLVVFSGIPPLVFNIPVIGFIGFFLSVVLGVWIIISIIRKNRI